MASSPLRRILTLLVAILALTLVPASPAAAQTTLDAELGFDGNIKNGRDAPLRIQVAADRLIRGELVVRKASNGGAIIDQYEISIPVEVAGGTTKEFVVVVPTVSQFDTRVTVELFDGDESLAKETVTATNNGTAELVGVLPSLSEELPAQADLKVDMGVARLGSVEPSWIGTRGAIDFLDTVVGTNEDLRALDEDSITTLLAWVNGGGQLLLESERGAQIGALPASAQPDATGPTTYGLGTIASTGGAISSTGWDSAISPTIADLSPNDNFGAEVVGDVTWFGGPLTTSLATITGFRLPSLPWMLGLLVAYVILGGPVLWLLLRRFGKTMWMWILLPLVALAFTGAVWMAGSSLRSGTDDAHGTTIEIHDQGASARSLHLVTSRSGGIERLGLPDDWRPSGIISPYFESPSRSVSVDDPQGSPTLEAELDAGDFTLLAATGPVDQYANGLVIDATTNAENIVTGTITNNLGVDVKEVGVFADLAGVNVGDIAAGETVEFTIRDNPSSPFNGQPVEQRVWRDAAQNGGFNDFGPFGPTGQNNQEINAADLSMWTQYVAENLGHSRPLGQVVVAAWTLDLASPVDADISSGRTLFVGRAPIDGDAGQVNELDAQLDLMRGPGETPNGDGGFGGEFVVGATWRFTLPADAPSNALVMSLPTSHDTLELWNGDEWREVTIDSRRATILLPPEVIIDGTVHSRLYVSGNRGPGLAPRSFVLRSFRPDDELTNWTWTDEADETEEGEA